MPKRPLNEQGDGGTTDVVVKKVTKVKVALILGHESANRKFVKENEFTHDWSIYVRGDGGAPIESYIERVVFKLHTSFANPIQEKRSPPFELHEQGYGTFELLLDVHFKNNKVPKMISYKYDLILPGPGVAPIQKNRKEILTFTNPNSEFMARLKSGGGMVSESDVKVPRKQLKPSAESSSKKPLSDHTPPKKKIPKVSHSKERKSEPEKAKSSGEHRSSTPDIKIKKVSKPHKQSLEKNKLSSFLAEIAGDQESSDDDRPPPKKHGTPSSSDRKKEKTRSKPSHKSSKSLLQEKEKRSSKARAESFLEFEELNLKKIKQEKIKETKTAQPEPKKSKPNKPSKPDNPAKAVSKDPPLSPLSSDIDSDADIDPDEWFKKEAARTERKRQAERKRESSVKVEVKTEIKEEKLEKVEVKKEPKPEPDQPLQYVKKELFNESDSSIEEGACEKSPPPPPIAKPSPPVAKPSPPDIKPSPQALKPYPIAARAPSPLAAPPPPPPQLATSVSRPQITATTLVHHTEPEMPRIPKIPKIQKDVPKVAKIPKIPKIKREIVPKKEVPDKKEVPVKKEVKKESRIEEKQRTVKDEDLEQGELPESSDHVQLSPFREIPSLEDEFRPDSKRRMTSESSTSSAGFIEQAPRPATPCEMTPEHLKFLLNVYNKLYKLNKLDRHEHFQTVVNCITDSRCKYDVNEEDFQFDLLTCDRETLIKINDTLS